MDISQFIYSAIEGHWFLPGWGDYKAAINIPMQIFVWKQVFKSAE